MASRRVQLLPPPISACRPPLGETVVGRPEYAYMQDLPKSSDYKSESPGYKTARSRAVGPKRAGQRSAADRRGGEGAAGPPDLVAIEGFFQLLGRAVRQFHTYPPTSPLCVDAS